MNPTIDFAQAFDPGAIQLSALREDLQLQEAARGLDGAPHWNLFDPVRNRFFRIGWLEFEMLTRWQSGMRVAQLCQQVNNETILQAAVDDVLSLLSFLEHSELLQRNQASQRSQLQSRQRKQTVWQWFLHNYLFFRVPLIKPNAFLQRTVGYLDFVFRPSFFICLGIIALLGVWRVLDQWSAFTSTFMYFFSWQGLALYGIALGLTKTIHEFAHAYTAKHYGLHVPTMGVAFMMLWPLLYTDTSEGWKLNSRRARLAIGGAGVVAELLLAGVAALAWSVLPDGGLKSAAYVLAAVTWISTLAINLNPFMRFDGYYLTMDWLDMPNLHQRSFAFGKWWLRKLILGIDMPIPEPEFESSRRWLIAFALTTWLYRLVLFLGIAALVYYFFFKLAGVILFAVEIGWFVVRPIWQEMQAWLTLKQYWQARRVWLSGAFLLFLLLICAIPWRSEIAAPGLAQAVQHTRLFPSMAAQVKQVHVQEGQSVRAGEVLFDLQSPELNAQALVMRARIAGIEAQLERAIGNASLIERVPLWQQELQAAQSALQSLNDESARLQVKAPHAGVVRDVDSGLYLGTWVAPQRILARLVDQSQLQAQVFVNETDVARIKAGATARVLTHRADSRTFSATVESIDTTPTHVLPHAMLASTYGGPLAARNGARGELLSNEALYRVNLRLENSQDMPDQLHLVQAEISGEHSSWLGQLVRRVAGVLVRESGF